MDDNKSPEDILDAILNRTPDSSPSPTSYPPKFDLPDDIFLPPAKEPEGREDSDKTSKSLPWLCLVLGIALLVMGICVLQVMGMNNRLDELQEMIAEMQAADSLREENEQLQQKVSEMQDTIDEMQQELQDSCDPISGNMEQLYIQQIKETILRERSEYLSFLQQFIDRGDFPMAAIIMMLEDETFRSTTLKWSPDDDCELPEMNSIQQAQYDSYRKILVDAGYLYNSGLTQKNGTTPLWGSGWDPSENPDMAALGILWCALEGYYVEGDVYKSMQYLVTNYYTPLGSEEDGALAYPQRLPNIAGEGTMRMYQQLIRDLCGSGYMVEEHGVPSYAPDQFYTDILYTLPFELPVNTALIPAGN